MYCLDIIPHSYFDWMPALEPRLRMAAHVWQDLDGSKMTQFHLYQTLYAVDVEKPNAETSESVGWQNFGKMLLVSGCIGSDFCN